MGKKIAAFYILFFVFLSSIYANRGNSLTYQTLNCINLDKNFTPQSFMEDFQRFLKSYYSVTIENSKESIVKYDFKKYFRFENTIGVRKHDTYLKMWINIEQQQPYLFHRKTNDDYLIYINFTRYIHGNENEEEIEFFIEDLDNKIDLFIKEHNLKTILS